MPAVDTRTMQLGDIIISNSGKIVSHCGIIADTTTVKTGGGNVDRPNIVYHATASAGVGHDGVDQWAQARGKSGVFRFKALRHMTQGGKPAAQKIAETARKLAGRCAYGKGRAYFKSWTGTASYGVSARGRVQKYLDRLNTNNSFVSDVYCSEYVVLCYQLAALGDESAAYFIDLDGKHALPKDLRNWLLQRTVPGGSWSYVGDLV